MTKFEIPPQPLKVNKTFRLSINTIERMEKAIGGKNCTISHFVRSAVDWNLKNLENTDEKRIN